MKYTDHFADKSADYLQFRPNYPTALFEYLVSLLKTHDLAWDCGTGNGQAALALANYFKQIIATDYHQAQLDIAQAATNIQYEQSPAEHVNLPNESVDLVTIAQALHWFDFPLFYAEVKRVLKPDGIIAAWSYSLGNISPTIDAIIRNLYEEVLGDVYWPKERRYIDDGYKTIPFPFKQILPPEFSIKKTINLPYLVGYLQTWSALKEYQKRNGTNPLEFVMEPLKAAWGEGNKQYTIEWPIHLLVGSLHTRRD